jgi:hypothetical protein
MEKLLYKRPNNRIPTLPELSVTKEADGSTMMPSMYKSLAKISK